MVIYDGPIRSALKLPVMVNGSDPVLIALTTDGVTRHLPFDEARAVWKRSARAVAAVLFDTVPHGFVAELWTALAEIQHGRPSWMGEAKP